MLLTTIPPACGLGQWHASDGLESTAVPSPSTPGPAEEVRDLCRGQEGQLSFHRVG